MKQYTYLLIDTLTIVVCFIFSFHKKISFYRLFLPLLKGMLLVSLPFLAWDALFTERGFWWFDKSYTIGLDLLGLPLEECLFFFCIPFSCVFTYYCVEKFFKPDRLNKYQSLLVWPSLLLLTLSAILFHDRWYTLLASLLNLTMLIWLHFIARVNWLVRASLVYLLLMPGFFLVNGLLTGSGLASPIVNYNPQEMIGLRILTIPIEDFVYGYALFMLNIYCFMRFTSTLTAAIPAPPTSNPA